MIEGQLLNLPKLIPVNPCNVKMQYVLVNRRLPINKYSILIVTVASRKLVLTNIKNRIRFQIVLEKLTSKGFIRLCIIDNQFQENKL